jgi:hypothetical protein
MVRLEREDSGILVLRFHQPYGVADEADYLAALEDIAREPGSFALLTIFGGGGGLSPAGEREQALWFKRNRALMDERCRALAIVRPGAGEEMAQVFRRLWSFPIMATPDEAVGRHFLAEHVGAPP